MFLPDLRARLLLPTYRSCTASHGVLQHVGLLSAYRASQPSQAMTADACLVPQAAVAVLLSAAAWLKATSGSASAA